MKFFPSMNCPKLNYRSSTAARTNCRLRSRRAGFTFTEVLFAMLLMGIGFIMLAAMFPISIREIQSSVEDTAGAGVGPSAVRLVGQYATASNLPYTSTIVGQRGAVASIYVKARPVWSQIAYSQVMSFDRRIGWTGLYRRDLGDNFAQVYIFVLQDRNASQYTVANDVLRVPIAGSYPATLEPRSVNVTLTKGPPDLITFSQRNPNYDGSFAVAPGSFVVIANDNTSSGSGNGRVYRVGQATSTANQYQLLPGNDMVDNTENVTGATAYVVGKGYKNPTAPGNTAASYDGPAQDIGFYTGFVPLY